MEKVRLDLSEIQGETYLITTDHFTGNMSIMSISEGFPTVSIVNHLHDWNKACRLPKELYVDESTLFNEGFRYDCAITNIKVKNS